MVSSPEAEINKNHGGQSAHLLLEGPQEETSRSPSLYVFLSLPLSLVFFLSSPLFLTLLLSLSRRLARPMSLSSLAVKIGGNCGASRRASVSHIDLHMFSILHPP
jgi:hypothetical protein